MDTWNFVTTNDYKYKKFMEVAEDIHLNCVQLHEQTPEIQAESNSDVAKFSAKWAAEKFQKNVICEDVGIYIDYYRGFPGVYLSQVEKWLGSNGFLKLMDSVTDRRARWEYAVAYCRPGEEAVGVCSFLDGKISLESEGIGNWEMDRIFIPKGEDRTIAELLDTGEFIRNNDHYQELIRKISHLD